MLPPSVDPALVEDERFLSNLEKERPDDPGVLRRLSQLRLRLGMAEAALAAAERAAALAPEDGEALAARGRALRALGRLDEARAGLERAVSLAPRSAEAWSALGECLSVAPGGLPAAADALRKAAQLAPRNARIIGQLAAALMGLGRHDEALAAYRAAMAAMPEPNPADLLNNFGVALERMERRPEAVAVLRAASLVRPDSASIQDNLGNALLSVADAPGAETCHRRALALGAKGAETWSNLANSLHRQGRLDEADSAYRRAVQMAPHVAKFHTNLALNLLLDGRYEEGWREYEWRWREHPSLPAYLKDKAWDGSPLGADLPAGGTLLLQAEQGYGDTIQFIRYAPLLKGRGVNRVILACQPELVRIVESADGVDQVVSELGPLPPFDRALTLMSLAGIFRAGLEPIPARTPYLKAPQGAGIPLPPVDGRLRVGLAWAGRPTHGDDWNRSIPARLLAPLLECPGVAFHSLQRGAVAERIGRPPPGSLIEMADLCADFADTAAVVDQLDLVISVDTAVVHLAAALGKPVWVMLPPIPDFRWLRAGETSPWYPSLRLLRKDLDSGWEPVIAQAVRMLTRFVEESASSST